MKTMTIRVPEDKHARLRVLAKSRGISVNTLINELATTALAQHDVEVRFRLRSSRGKRATGLALLDKLDRVERTRSGH